MLYHRRMRASSIALAAALIAASGCASMDTGAPGPWRDPAFRPSAVRRPAVYLQVSLERVGLGSGPFSAEERAGIPERYESAVQESLNGLGILPVDITLEARRAERTNALPLEGLKPAAALARAREIGADHLVIVDARLSRRDLALCRQGGRALVGTATYWEAGLEVLRVSDGAQILLEPPGAEQRVLDIEIDCRQGRLIRRKAMDEMVEESVGKILAPLRKP